MMVGGGSVLLSFPASQSRRWPPGNLRSLQKTSNVLRGLWRLLAVIGEAGRVGNDIKIRSGMGSARSATISPHAGCREHIGGGRRRLLPNHQGRQDALWSNWGRHTRWGAAKGNARPY